MRGINAAILCLFVVHCGLYAFSVVWRGISGPGEFSSSFTFVSFALVVLLLLGLQRANKNSFENYIYMKRERKLQTKSFKNTNFFFNARTSTTMRIMAPITPKKDPKMIPVHTKNSILITLGNKQAQSKVVYCIFFLKAEVGVIYQLVCQIPCHCYRHYCSRCYLLIADTHKDI